MDIDMCPGIGFPEMFYATDFDTGEIHRAKPEGTQKLKR